MSVEKIIDDLVAAVRRRDAKAVGALFAKDSEFAEMVGTGGVTYGQEKIQELWNNFFKDVSHDQNDNKWVIHRKIISGNNAVLERTSYFTFKGRKVVINMVTILEIENDKIKVYRDYCDSRIFIPQENTEEWKAYCDSLKKLGATTQLKN
ncbi:MAG: nuclear transport factor 2 family protein [Coxiellaceae bacterium]|nr:nuclear transport factor 2 family protein [Coxiellaceae bacterium]